MGSGSRIRYPYLQETHSLPLASSAQRINTVAVRLGETTLPNNTPFMVGSLTTLPRSAFIYDHALYSEVKAGVVVISLAGCISGYENEV